MDVPSWSDIFYVLLLMIKAMMPSPLQIELFLMKLWPKPRSVPGQSPILFLPYVKNAVTPPKNGCTVMKWYFLCSAFDGQGYDAQSHANWTIFDEVMVKTTIGSWTIPILFLPYFKNAVTPPKIGCTVVKWYFLCILFDCQGNDA